MAVMNESVRRVDQSAIRVSQALIIVLLMSAFVFDSAALAGIVAAAMLLGALLPPIAPLQQAYFRLLKPAGVVRPDIIPDNPEPHRFAQGMGGTVVALATLALLAGATVLGWALAWLVVILAAANLFLGFCAGCFLYYQLNRLGVPGFRHGPLRRR